MGAAMSMQEAEVAPTTRQIAAGEAARAQLQDVMARWNGLRSGGALTARGGEHPVLLPG